MWAGGIAAFVILLCLAQVFVAPKFAPPPAIMPVRNGYDDFVKASSLLAPLDPDWDAIPLARLRPLMASNAPALALVHLGLTRECRTPLAYTPDYFATNDFGRLRNVAVALAADAKVAEADNRFGDAAFDDASIIAFGRESARGGLLIHSLVQIAIVSLGVKPLQRETPRLTAEESRRCLRLLQKSESDAEPFNRIRKREEIYAETIDPIKVRLLRVPLRLLGRDPVLATARKTEIRLKAQSLTLLNLEAALAAQAFQMENGRAAAGWNDLVPAYLPAIPTNPVLTQPLSFGAW